MVVVSVWLGLFSSTCLYFCGEKQRVGDSSQSKFSCYFCFRSRSFILGQTR
uniref:Predicted protein n=1 Tax=Hordeum vulgare subsp. vulgare TaxID=112509 RepID=F2DYC5_HORVV|nr:predicted protein [Hordeum vulgare subsp. vulgare]